MKFLIIDNYDSFVYNIAQYLGELGVESDVIRNDKITLDEIKEKNYNAIIISPGPGTPEEKKYFGICLDVISNMGAIHSNSWSMSWTSRNYSCIWRQSHKRWICKTWKDKSS